MRAGLLLCLLLPAVAVSQSAPQVALGGLDPVALCRGEEIAGSQNLTTHHGRYGYRFASDANREQFLVDPERWGIQWGGGCARMGPLSGRGSPDRWLVHLERIYIFASDGCREGFAKAPARFVTELALEPPWSGEKRRLGREWFAKAVAAHGGAEALAAVRMVRMTATREQKGWKNQRELVIGADGAVRSRSVWAPPEDGEQGSDTVWVASAQAFTVENGVVYDLSSAAERDDVRRLGQREPLAILWARDAEGLSPVHHGTRKLGRTNVVDVAVHSGGLATTLHLNAKDGRIVGLSWNGRPSDGVTSAVTEVFTAWRTVEGILIPTARDTTADGKRVESMSGRWDEVTLHSEVDAAAFRRPAPR